MNDHEDVEAMLDRFRDWLRDLPEPPGALAAAPAALASASGAEPAREFGIIELIEAFTALRQELKLQTKSGRGLLEQTEGTVAALLQAIEQFRSVAPREDQAAWAAGKSFALALVDLDEAIDRGQGEIERARQQIAEESVRGLEHALDELYRGRSWIGRRLLRDYHTRVVEAIQRDGASRHELFDSFLEGFGLIQNRLRRALAAEKVERIVCQGQPVDPERMTVLEIVDLPDRPGGTVAKEYRRGYTWKGRVLRFAEVQAVRARTPGHRPHPSAPGAAERDELEVHAGSEMGAAWIESD